MRKYIIGVVVGVLLTSAVVVLAGNLDSPGASTDAGAQMYTLEQIYERLDTGAAATKMTQFMEPAAGPGSTMHTLDEIYDLIGERAHVPKTGQTVASVIHDDGHLEKGVAWPSPRFITGTTGIVTDTLTGLIWLEDADCFGIRSWTNAVSDARTLASGSCGLTDGSVANQWRLPNVRELHSLIHFGFDTPALPNTAGTGKWSEGDPFTDVWASVYWSSTSYAFTSASAWYVSLGDGEVDEADKGTTRHVWPVRGGQ